ncbi:MAG: cytochrome C biogenesis protein [Oscillospiraceae bacterium]|nr:cytochrome C biogenesis protein [Oscillospiraceae bacterium]
MFCKIEIYVPVSHVQPVKEALWKMDAGHIGHYDHCVTESPVTGYFRPLKGATPYIGVMGSDTRVEEIKLEVVCRAAYAERTVNAVKEAHPYEEPVINVIPLIQTGL